MTEYMINKLGKDLCSWISKTESYIFGDIIPHALLNIEYKQKSYLFISSLDLINEYRMLFEVQQLEPVLRRHNLQQIIEMQLVSCLRCWFNGTKIVGSYVKLTQVRKLILFNGLIVIPKYYERLGFEVFTPTDKPTIVKPKLLEQLFIEDIQLKQMLIERLKQDKYIKTKEFNDEVLLEIFKRISKAASGRNGYILWILESYINSGIRSLEDLGTVKSSLKTFTELLGKEAFKDFKNINRYCGLVGCDYKRLKQLSKDFSVLQTKGCDGLETRCGLSLSSILINYKKEYIGFVSKLTPEELKDIIYEDGTAFLVLLSSEKSAKCWGKGTQWCTAGDYDNIYQQYRKDGKLYVIVDKLEPYRERYQLHAFTKQYMKPDDSHISLIKLHDLYPKIITKDETKPLGPLWKPNLVTSSEYKILENEFLETVVEIPMFYKKDNFVITTEQFKNGFLRLIDTLDTVIDFTGVTKLQLPETIEISLTTYNLSSVEYLELNDYKFDDFKDIKLPKLKTLIINNKNAINLNGVSLPELENLQINYATSLEHVQLPNLKELKILSIESSFIFPKCLPQLQKIYIYSQYVMFEIPDVYPLLTDVELVGRFVPIPNTVRNLIIKTNILSKAVISESSIKHVKSLELYCCGIIFDVFNDSNLENLIVMDGSIIMAKSFPSLKHLQLTLSLNNFEQYNFIALSDLSSLETLSISGETYASNARKRTSDDPVDMTLPELPNLKKLFIANSNTFSFASSFSQLEEFKFIGNLEKLPELPKIKILDLNILNKEVILPRTLEHLEEFKFQGKFLSELPRLPKVKKITIKVKDVVINVQDFDQLEELVAETPIIINRLPQLKTLKIKYRDTKVIIPDTIPLLTTLHLLNSDVDLPVLHNLEELDIDKYDNQTLILKCLTKLRKLTIFTTATQFPSMPNLEELVIPGNCMFQLPPNLQSLKRLKIGREYFGTLNNVELPNLEELDIRTIGTFDPSKRILLPSLLKFKVVSDISPLIHFEIPKVEELILTGTKVPIEVQLEHYPNLKVLHHPTKVSGYHSGPLAIRLYSESVDLSEFKCENAIITIDPFVEDDY